MTATAARALQDVADSIVAAPDGPVGAILALSLPEGSTMRAVAGRARADGGITLTATTPFHVASVGKLVTATLVLRLFERGAFGPAGLDATLPQLAAAGLCPRSLATGIHPEADRITVRHLLTHTSGLKDFQVDDATGTAADHGGLAPGSIQGRYWQAVRDERRGRGDGAFARHRWSAWEPDAAGDELAGHLDGFVASGTAGTPVGHPGERFHYSDTAFVLLGLIVEAGFGMPYHEAQRRVVVDPLGMTGTYLAYHDDPTPDARTREMDVWLGGVALLSSGYDLSFDWGGGGQVSTVDDLLRLVRAVATGSCLRQPSTAAAMLAPRAPAGLVPPRIGIGLGVHHLRVGERTVIGHSGAWGVRAFVDPASGVAVAATVGRRDDGEWLAAVFDLAEAALHGSGPQEVLPS